MSRYDTDFYVWTQEQATLLRQGRLDELDVPHLAAELEALGRSEKREIRTRLKVLLMHLLKWQYQAQRRQGSTWRTTIVAQRISLEGVLEDNPSLQAHPAAVLAQAYQGVRMKAQEETQLPLATFPETCPYTITQALDNSCGTQY
jgi:hypothetical protein